MHSKSSLVHIDLLVECLDHETRESELMVLTSRGLDELQAYSNTQQYLSRLNRHSGGGHTYSVCSYGKCGAFDNFIPHCDPDIVKFS
jgi:hypothetical protein